MPREVVLPPVSVDPLELARRLFPEHREWRGEPADGRDEPNRETPRRKDGVALSAEAK